MITLNGRSFNISFVGECDIQWNNPISGSALQTNAFGLDTLTRDYQVRIDRKAIVENQLGRLKNRQDFEYKGLYLTSWIEREEGGFVIFSITFKGLFDGRLPNAKFSGGFAQLRATSGITTPTLVGLPSLQGTSIDVEYLGPFVTIQYVRRNIPTQPQYTSESIKGDIIFQSIDGEQTGLVNIYGIRTMIDQDRPLQPAPGRFNLKKVIQVDGPKYEQVGLFYECSETHQMMLQPFDMQNRISLL